MPPPAAATANHATIPARAAAPASRDAAPALHSLQAARRQQQGAAEESSKGQASALPHAARCPCACGHVLRVRTPGLTAWATERRLSAAGCWRLHRGQVSLPPSCMAFLPHQTVWLPPSLLPDCLPPSSLAATSLMHGCLPASCILPDCLLPSKGQYCLYC